MGFSTGLAALAVGTIGTLASIDRERAAGRSEARAVRAQRATARVQNVRARRRAIREALLQREDVTAAAIDRGVDPRASVVEGSRSSIQAQLASNIGFQQQLESLEDTRLRHMGKAQRRQQQAREFGAASQLAFQASGAAFGFA